MKEEFTNEILKKLKENATNLIDFQLPKALGLEQESKYRNLIQALDSTLRLIEKYEWQLKWSKFRDEKGNQHIAIWEQHINGDIRDNKDWIVVEENKTVDGETYGEQ